MSNVEFSYKKELEPKLKILDPNTLNGKIVVGNNEAQKSLHQILEIIDNLVGSYDSDKENFGDHLEKDFIISSLVAAWGVLAEYIFQVKMDQIKFSSSDLKKESLADVETMTNFLASFIQSTPGLIDELSPKQRVDLGLSESEETSVSLESLRKKSLEQLIFEWFLNDINKKETEHRLAFGITVKEKFQALKAVFIRHELEAVSKQDIIDGKTTKEKAQDLAIEKWKNFRDVYGDVAALMDYGVMGKESLVLNEGLAVHSKIMGTGEEDNVGAAAIDGAMERNTSFNKNPFVGLEGKTLDQAEMLADDMGIIQMIIFAAYQRLKDNKDPKYNRNQNYTGGLMDELIDHVCTFTEVPMWNHDKNASAIHAVDIVAEFAKYPPEIQDLIKFFAKLKLARDDLGREAALFIKGREKGAVKIARAKTSEMPDGLLARICYDAKNSKLNGVKVLSLFLSPVYTEFLRGDSDNNSDIIRSINEMDAYFTHLHPQLRGVIYPSMSNTTEGLIVPSSRDRAKDKGGVFESLVRHEPKRWNEDFPGLAHFFNQTEKVVMPGIYLQARDAVQKIVEYAIKSINNKNKMPTESTDIHHRVTGDMGAFATQISLAISYIGPYNDGGPDFNPRKPKHEKYYADSTSERAKKDKSYQDYLNKIEPNPLNYVSELISSALRFYVLNMLVNVPPSKNIGAGEVLARKNPLFKNMRDLEYHDRYVKTVGTIREVLNLNPTMTGIFQRNITGKIRKSEREEAESSQIKHRTDGKPALLDGDYRKQWEESQHLDNIYLGRVLRIADHHKQEVDGRPLKWREREIIADQSIDPPFSFDEGDVWSSSH